MRTGSRRSVSPDSDTKAGVSVISRVSPKWYALGLTVKATATSAALFLMSMPLRPSVSTSWATACAPSAASASVAI